MSPSSGATAMERFLRPKRKADAIPLSEELAGASQPSESRPETRHVNRKLAIAQLIMPRAAMCPSLQKEVRCLM